MQSHAVLDRFNDRLWQLTRHALRDHAEFREEDHSFVLRTNPFPDEPVHPGPYRMGQKVEDANTFRVGHVLAQRLIAAAQENDFAWQRLAELTDTYGARPAWSENLSRAIVWAAETMKNDGLENVHTERVMVPRWVRASKVPRSSSRRAARSSCWTRRHRGHPARRPRG